MSHTQKFTEAIQRISDAMSIQGTEHAERLFKEEMIALGWEERIKNLYRVKDKISGKFRFFTPNSEQLEFLKNKKNRDIILKSRQIGFTTLMCIYAYDRGLWDGWATGIMAHKLEKVKLIFDIVKNANDYFKKDWGHLYLPAEEHNNTTRISWSDLKSSITVAFDFQSNTLNFLHISEAAFIEGSRLTNSMQAVPENGEIVLESTPNGRGGTFYKLWQLHKSQKEFSPFKGHFFPWFKHYPEDATLWDSTTDIEWNDTELNLMTQYELNTTHLAWRRWKINESCEGSPEIFEVQYPSDDISCFLSGECNVFSSSVLRYQESHITDPIHIGFLKSENRAIRFDRDHKGIIKIWELPKPDTDYVIGADASEGSGKDPCCAIVKNRKNGHQVASLHGFLDPDLFADELWKLGMFYNKAWINPEANNHGHVVINELTKKSYGNLYKRYTIDEFTNRPCTKIGFLTTSLTKVPLTDKFVAACRDGKFKVKDDDLLSEMSTYIQMSSKNGRTLRREALVDCHDDRVMAACLAEEMDSRLATISPNEITDPLLGNSDFSVDPDTGFVMNNFNE